jgi:hypothetical protein
MQVVGIARIPLTQRRFRAGALYVSALVSSSELDGIDCRFFVEAQYLLTPTRKGFRIHRPAVTLLDAILGKALQETWEQTLWTAGNRRLIVRRCDDEYGQGVDFRFLMASDGYEDWEQRGIRLRDDDFLKLAEVLRMSGLLRLQVPAVPDVFLGKTIRAFSGSRAVGAAGSRNGQRAATLTPVGDALQEFLSEE